NVGGADGFVRKLASADGTPAWAAQFGTLGPVIDNAQALGSDGLGLYVAGLVNGPLAGQQHVGLADAYLRALERETGGFVPGGTTQLGSPAAETAASVYVDPIRGI